MMVNYFDEEFREQADSVGLERVRRLTEIASRAFALSPPHKPAGVILYSGPVGTGMVSHLREAAERVGARMVNYDLAAETAGKKFRSEVRDVVDVIEQSGGGKRIVAVHNANAFNTDEVLRLKKLIHGQSENSSAQDALIVLISYDPERLSPGLTARVTDTVAVNWPSPQV